MNLPSHRISRICLWLFVLSSTAVLAAAFVWLVKKIQHTAPLKQVRVEERMTILSNQVHAARLLTDYYAWQDTDKGFVRIPVELAKQITVEEWKSPQAARSNLMARAAILLAVPLPPPTSPAPTSTNAVGETNALSH